MEARGQHVVDVQNISATADAKENLLSLGAGLRVLDDAGLEQDETAHRFPLHKDEFAFHKLAHNSMGQDFGALAFGKLSKQF